MIQPSRIKELNNRSPASAGRYVVYWMQQSQRTQFNHALEYAVTRANELSQPLVVCFGLMDNYPDANERHYAFMLQGLADVAVQLKRRGIKFVLKHGQPDEVAIHYARDASLLVCDRGYLRFQKQWRESVAHQVKCPVVQVESDVVVPVEVTSDKAEFAARTIRPKIHKHLAGYLKPLPRARVKYPSIKLSIKSDEILLNRLKIDRSVKVIPDFQGGQSQAEKLLAHFVKHKLAAYSENRNEPSEHATSMLSPYLHFGQISPLQIALATRRNSKFIEELVVRRELSMNFVHYTENYDRFDCLPNWAKLTLQSHRRDKRAYIYSIKQLEAARTHDRYWNAAQTEMLRTGFMHNYMRMYWGKKILEWSRSPRIAYETTLYLNNRYFLDGRDPVSYANVGWIFGLHDRPWTRRPIFGTIRYMNAAGLERKFDMEVYIEKVEG
ncbi:MAG TPA: deoxyribodipyrimidine photo-lyase [Tepidisphaeraceae bacterium]|nr:deoxyribodipyrimidine photo-lyase [Tepidisphaeraceae bacterium]